MYFDRKKIKDNAKLHYEKNRGSSILVPLIFGMISYSGSYFACIILALVFAVPLAFCIMEVVGTTIAGSGEFDSIYIISYLGLWLFGLISSFVSYLVVAPLTVGVFSWYNQSIYKRKLSIGTIFSPFKSCYFKAIWLFILKGLIYFVGVLLLVFPALIAHYGLSQAEFILAENPDMKVSEALKQSWELTKSHKFDLFILDLSFLGWFILSSLTFGILAMVYVIPYYFAAKAFAYEHLKSIKSLQVTIE